LGSGLYAEAQPSLYRSGVGAPNYQIFNGIALLLRPRFANSRHVFLSGLATTVTPTD
jgi:hypothetical protein